MNTYVALLYSIVLSTENRVKMAELRCIAETAGFSNARTLVSTGNLIVESAEKLSVSDVEQRLEQGIASAFGRRIDVIALSESDWQGLVAGNPFADESAIDGSRVGVRVMRSPLAAESIAELETYRSPGDRMAVVAGHLWLFFSGKPSEGRLLSRLTTKRLGVGTLRNWNTVKGLSEMLSGGSDSFTQRGKRNNQAS